MTWTLTSATKCTNCHRYCTHIDSISKSKYLQLSSPSGLFSSSSELSLEFEKVVKYILWPWFQVRFKVLKMLQLKIGQHHLDVQSGAEAALHLFNLETALHLWQQQRSLITWLLWKEDDCCLHHLGGNYNGPTLIDQPSFSDHCN